MSNATCNICYFYKDCRTGMVEREGDVHSRFYICEPCVNIVFKLRPLAENASFGYLPPEPKTPAMEQPVVQKPAPCWGCYTGSYLDTHSCNK